MRGEVFTEPYRSVRTRLFTPPPAFRVFYLSCDGLNEKAEAFVPAALSGDDVVYRLMPLSTAMKNWWMLAKPAGHR